MASQISIIGGGVSGLTIAYRLVQAGHQVTLFETASQLGGLAAGFHQPDWNWPIEQHYHHIFKTDTAIQQLATEIKAPYFFKTPVTSILYNGQINPFDGPQQILSYPFLSIPSRLRLGAAAAFLKVWPFHKTMVNTTAKQWIKTYMGNQVWEVIWRPLFEGKFGSYADQISMVWFWARIHARSQQLGYFEGGFQGFIDTLAQSIRQAGGQIYTNTPVQKVERTKNTFKLKTSNQTFKSRYLVIAAPRHILTQLHPAALDKQTTKLDGLGAVTLVMALKKKFFTDNTYWLNINQPAPFLALVEHTNFISPQHYNNQHLLYIGNYLKPDHAYFDNSAKQLTTIFLPHLQSINPRFTTTDIINQWAFKARFAQPIIRPGHQPYTSFTTKIPNLWWVSMQHVYPWDRGTNFAVEWGNKLSQQLLKQLQ